MITTEKEYQEKLDRIDEIMKKGEDNIDVKETALLQKMVTEVSAYENEHIVLPAPKTIPEMVELKLFEKKMSQTEFARRTGLGIPKVNQIIKGKRNIDIPFLKAIYSELNIPADFLLRVI